MALEVPLSRLKLTHSWPDTPLGSILQIYTSNDPSRRAIGFHAQYKEGDRLTLHGVVIIPEPGQAAFMQPTDTSSGATDLSEDYELIALDPQPEPLEHRHKDLLGLLLSTSEGHLYVRAQMGRHILYIRIDAGDPQQQWQATMEIPRGVRATGILGVRPKPKGILSQIEKPAKR